MKLSLKWLNTLTFMLTAIASQSQTTKFTVASWNIGHFALGQQAETKIQPSEATERQADYRRAIDSLKADIIAVSEYNPEFVMSTADAPAIMAREAVFARYADAKMGPKYNYNCNCIFSNGFTTSNEKVMNYAEVSQKRYYLCVTFNIGGKDVKVVSTHLDCVAGYEGLQLRTGQIRELIESFKDEPFVIMCGDWNVEKTEEYDPFLKAGYRMANHGERGDLTTWPATKPKDCLDNIIVKGFDLEDTQVVSLPTLSDHCVITCNLSLPKQ